MFAIIFPTYPLPDSDFGSSFDSAFGDPNWAATARRDPAVQVAPRATVRAGVATMTGSEKVLERLSDLKLPLLVLHARGDTRTLLQGALDFFEGAASTDKGMKILESHGHQLLQDKADVIASTINEIRSWLQKHV